MSNLDGNDLLVFFSFFWLNQDILSKVVAFTNQGPITITVLSATGAVSTATICYPSGINNYKVFFFKLCSFTTVVA